MRCRTPTVSARLLPVCDGEVTGRTERRQVPVDGTAPGVATWTTIPPMAIESFDQLLFELREHPEWREQLRAVVLGERQVAVPDVVDRLGRAQERTQQQLDVLAGRVNAIAGHVDELAERMVAFDERMIAFDERMTAFDERMIALARAQEITEVRLQGLAEQLSAVGIRADRAIGYLVEQQYRGKAHAYFQTIARRVRLVPLDRLDDLLDAAIEAGSVTEVEASEVRWADAVLQGRRNGDAVFLVLESSAVVDTDDVERAARRSSVVGRLGAPSLAIAAGEKILPEAAAAARRLGVWLVTDGHVEAPAA